MSKIYNLTVFCMLALSTATAWGQDIQRQTRAAIFDKGSEIVIPAADSRLKGMTETPATLGSLPKSMLLNVQAAKARDPKSSLKTSPSHVKASGAIQGYLGFVSGSYTLTQGWYNVSVPTSTNLWKNAGFYPSCGYVRDGKLYTWYHRTSTSEGVYEIGVREFNVANGSQTGNQTFGLFDGYDKVVWNCAYDTDNDLVYLFTSRPDDVNAYMTQVYDPATGVFTALGEVNDADWPIAMAWNPADGNVYTLMEDGIVKRLDKRTGKFANALNTGHNVSDFSGAMVYSPKDKGMIYMCASYDDDTVNEMGLIDMVTGQQTTLGYTQYDEQWLILHTPDAFSVAGAPAQAEFVSWDFTKAQLTGSMKLKMPALDNNGNTITSTLFLEVTVDSESTPVYDGNVTAGAEVSVPLTLTEGVHTLHARPYIYSGIDKAYATPLHVEKYAGNDNPQAPANVQLTKTRVSWAASPSTGAHGGYVNTASLRYNVYINGTKMNSTPVNGTSLDITLPKGDALYVAEVEATAAGKVSERAQSNTLQADGPLELPVYLGPAEGETDMTQEMRDLFTILNCNNDNRTWIYDEQKEKTGGFYYLCQTDNPGDDWLVLPAINFPDASSVYSFAFEVWANKHYFAGIERYEVGISTDLNPTHMTIIKEAEDVIPTDNFQPVEVLFTPSESGRHYIGIHAISIPNQYRLYARNFHVTKTESGASAPAAVTSLQTEAAADGTLFITAQFDMPEVDIAGNALAADTEVTANVTTGVDSKSVTARAGAHASVTLGARQGMNTLVVTSSSAAGQGGSVSTELFAGVDTPAGVRIGKIISADNRSMTLNWSVPERGENGGPVIATDCQYTLMRHNGQAWLRYMDLGSATTYTFTVDAGAPQDIVQLGVLASNAAGESSTFTTAGDILGQPLGLPMLETWPYQGENVSPKYDPYMIQAITTDLYPSWGFCDPAALEDKGVTPNESGIALTAYWLGESQVTFPKFSTLGMNNVKADLSMYFGAVTPQSIEVLGSVDNDEYVLLATFSGSDGNGWEVKTVDLPSHMQNREWVALTVRVHIASYSQYFLLDRYEIKNYPTADMAATTITGDTFGNVGTPLHLTAGIRNMGAESIELPDALCEVLNGNQVISSMTVEKPSATAYPGEETLYSFTLTPDASMLGTHTLRFSFASDDEVASNNTTETDLHIFSHNLPVPQNLTGRVTDEGAVLTWDEPQVIFGAEECVPGDRREHLGLFRNLDMDQLDSYALSGVNYPGRYEPIGYQVIATSSLPLPPLMETAHDNVLMTLASSQGSQDNWLVSPQVKGGTTVTFDMACASPCDGVEYMDEVIQIWASPVANNPSSFKKVDEFTNSEVKWKRCTATLPDDAKYFAIVYQGGSKCFCVFIDNITYTPAEYAGPISGYRITRGADKYQTFVTDRTWTDTSYDSMRPAAWNVCTVMNILGDDIDSAPSDALIIPVGVTGVARQDTCIEAHEGYIVIKGYDGKSVSVSNTQGVVVARRATVATGERIALAPGIYMVRAGNRTHKVVVR